MAKLPTIPNPLNYITGTESNNILNGTSQNDYINAGGGDDIINAGRGNDTVLAGTGNDVVIHNFNDNMGSKDYYDGGTGNDTLQLVVTQSQYNMLQAALLDFNSSNKSQEFDFSKYNKDFNLKIVNIEHITFEILEPTVQFQNTQISTATASCHTPCKDTTITGTNHNDMLVGGPGRNTIYGLDGDDKLVGGPCDDTLIGGKGNDTIIGGAGDDCINAGAGNDVVNGSAGADTVVHFVDENQGFHDYYQDSGTSVQNCGQDTLILVFSNSDYAKITALIHTMEADFAAAKKNGVVFDFSQYNTALTNLGVSKTLMIDTKGFEKLEVINATEAQHRADCGDPCFGTPQLNHAPTVGADSFTTHEDDPFNGTNHTITLGNKLSNDTDADGDTLHLVSLQNVHLDTTYAGSPFNTMTITLVDGSFTDGNGTTVLLTMGGQTATINIDLLGNETLSDPNHLFNALSTNESIVISADYTITDGHVNSTGPQTITITGVNDAPVAVNDAYSTNEDTPLTITPAGILINDTDVDGDTLSSILNVGPAHGTLILAADGSFLYTPDANFNGTDTFTYHANDGSADSNIATVCITVNSVNDAPVAVNDSYSTNEDTPLTITPAGVLINDTDVDGDTLSSILNVGPAHGTLSLAPDGSFLYTPDANFNGTDTFTYHANDGSADSNIATVCITVNSVNDAPVAHNDTYSTNEDTPLTITPAGILINDTDVDGDTLSSILNVGPAHGTLSLAPDGSFLYTPDANFNGTDTFTYHANDGSADSNIATVCITVNSVNDAPVAVNDSYSTNEDTPLTITPAGVLINDTDVDGDTLSSILNVGPAHGTLSLAPDGSFLYTPDANFNGTDTFTYHANDGSADSNIATVCITVNSVNDAPVAHNDTYSTNEDTPLTITPAGILINDTDVDGDTLSSILNVGPAHGTLSLAANGSFVYTPNADYNGTDTFTYHANDGTANSNIATVTITINPVDEQLIATPDNDILVNEAALDLFQGGADLAAGTRTGTNPTSTAETDNTGNSLASSVSGGSGVVAFTLVGGTVGAGFTTLAGTNGTLKLFSDGTYLYTLTSPVSGPIADNGANTEVREHFTYQVNDADGQTTTSTISVSIVDDVAVSNVTNGIAQNSTNTILNGTLANMGADSTGAHVVLTVGSMPTGLSSGGVALTYSVSADGSDITAKAGVSGPVVFDMIGNADGTYVFHQVAALDLTILTSDLQSSVGAGGPQAAYYFYTNGQFGSLENASDWAVKITGSDLVNPSTQGMGVSNNLFQKTNNLAETLKFEFDDEHASTIGGTTPNLTYIAKFGVTGLDVGETLTYTAYYVDGTNSGLHTVTSAELVSGTFTVAAPTNGFLDYIDLAAGPTDTSVRINSFTSFIQDDTQTKVLNFGYKAIDGDGDSTSGTVSITEGNSSTLTGTASNDAMGGGFGNNVILGSAGNDILTGGLGNDVITGGTGTDNFVFSLMNNAGHMQMQGSDTITDLALGDKLTFHGVLDVVGGGDGSNIADLNAQSVFSDTGTGNANLLVTFSGGGSITLNGLGNHSIHNFSDLTTYLPEVVVVS
jgi:VCBS repeat-containing protein